MGTPAARRQNALDDAHAPSELADAREASQGYNRQQDDDEDDGHEDRGSRCDDGHDSISDGGRSRAFRAVVKNIRRAGMDGDRYESAANSQGVNERGSIQ